MSNTIDSNLALDIASAKVLKTLEGIPTPLFKIFDTDISAAPEVGKFVNVKVYKPGSIATKGSGAYADADGTYDLAPVSMTERYVTIDMIGAEMQDYDLGSFERQVEEATRKLVHGIEKEGAEFAFANAVESVTAAPAAFDAEKAGEVAKELSEAGAGLGRAMLLNPDYYENLLNSLDADTFGSARAAQDGIAGKVRGMHVAESLASIQGVAFDKTAFVLGARGVLNVADYAVATTVIDPVSGLPISIKLINDERTNRKTWVVSCRYGFAEGNTDASVKIEA